MHPRPVAPPGPAALAARLRELRKQWPGVRITQEMVARALGGSTPLVSSWESTTNPSVPPDVRLAQYATLFATRRSLQGGFLRLLPEEELTAEELAERDRLHQELLALRATGAAAAHAGRPRSTWHFPDAGPVRLVCGRLPEVHRGDYASPTSYNYTELHGYADVDAMVELFGHVRMLNPDSDVRFMLAENMQSDDLNAHVVLIGGLQWNRAARFYARTSGLPVRQVEDESVQDGEVFEIERDGRRRRFLPTFLEGDPALGLIEDVALFARMPNPGYPQRTLTICNGTYSRGVYGAVRLLTDAKVRDTNEDYLARRFADTPEFGLLLRVPVLGGATLTPDLTSDYHRLFVWPARDEPAAGKEPA
jgi:hypothetical protein